MCMASTLVQETVISHVDNCKIFQYWLLFFQFASLQSLLYVLATMLFYNHISDHITSCKACISSLLLDKFLFLNMLVVPLSSCPHLPLSPQITWCHYLFLSYVTDLVLFF